MQIILTNNKINTNHLKSFRLSDLFSISSGDCIRSTDTDNEPNEKLIPYITRGRENHSIDSYVRNKPTQKGNCITIGTQGATAYYQDQDFISGTGVNILRSEHLNLETGLFICTVLNKAMQSSYKFGYELSQSRLKNTKIKLPSIVNEDGTYFPDWKYMEEYIKNIRKNVRQGIRNIFNDNE